MRELSFVAPAYNEEHSRVRALRSAPGVLLDLLKLGRLARRPLERRPERTPAPSVGTHR